MCARVLVLEGGGGGGKTYRSKASSDLMHMYGIFNLLSVTFELLIQLLSFNRSKN